MISTATRSRGWSTRVTRNPLAGKDDTSRPARRCRELLSSPQWPPPGGAGVRDQDTGSAAWHTRLYVGPVPTGVKENGISLKNRTVTDQQNPRRRRTKSCQPRPPRQQRGALEGGVQARRGPPVTGLNSRCHETGEDSRPPRAPPREDRTETLSAGKGEPAARRCEEQDPSSRGEEDSGGVSSLSESRTRATGRKPRRSHRQPGRWSALWSCLPHPPPGRGICEGLWQSGPTAGGQGEFPETRLRASRGRMPVPPPAHVHRRATSRMDAGGGLGAGARH